MTPAVLAQLHALCFAQSAERWSEASFAEILALPSTFLITAQHGFALGQKAGPEVELLTLAVHPDARRQGVATQLLQAFVTKAMEDGAAEVFLDVAEDNVAARALYAGAGFIETGRRTRYYRRPAGAVDAILMMRTLRQG